MAVPVEPIRLFISYSNHDLSAARALKSELLTLGYDTVLFDDIPAGTDIVSIVDRAVGEADFVISLMSSEYMESSFAMRELELALQLEASKGRVVLIPLMVSGDMPALLANKVYIRYAGESEAASVAQRIARDLGRHRQAEEQSWLTTSVKEIVEIRSTPPVELVQAIAAGNCVLYAGAGLGNYAGFPVWRTLVTALLDRAHKDRFFKDEEVANFSSNIRENRVDYVVDEIDARVDATTMRRYLQEIFDRPSPQPEAHAVLATLPFKAALTTSFDRLLEKAFHVENALTPFSGDELWAANKDDRFYVLKLYGDLSTPDRSVFVGPLQFEAAMRDNSRFSEFMEALFGQRTVVFVGCSLEGIESYLRAIRFRGKPGRHFAITGVLGTSAWQPLAKTLERRYGIHVWPYRANDGVDLLHLLHQLKQAVFESGVSPAPPATSSPLRRLELRDIGPFEHLSLDLNADTNILLGSNGAGKSTILRAIAVAYCGKEAEPHAERLIRAGAGSGSIILTTDRGKYEVHLERGQAGAIMNIIPARPLEPEGLPVLGFPALRSASGHGLRGPSMEGWMIPHVTDVLPLAAGDFDLRMDHISQWLVNLDYRAKDERARGGDSSRYELLITKFFSILADLTDGLHIEFSRVDPGSKKVYVKTEHGELPIDQVSQGTASLVSWIGVLLQRMFDIYGHDADPTELPAIALVDEIDAHMHPRWQRLLLSKLRGHFKNLQIIATTHSPLMVSGLESRCVFVVSRSQVRNFEMKLDGLEADRILTSPLFDLEDARDVGTETKHKTYQALRNQLTLTEEEKARKSQLALELFGPSGDDFDARVNRVIENLRNPLAEEDKAKILLETQSFVDAVLLGKGPA